MKVFAFPNLSAAFSAISFFAGLSFSLGRAAGDVWAGTDFCLVGAFGFLAAGYFEIEVSDPTLSCKEN
jgi:hypothetical protein